MSVRVENLAVSVLFSERDGLKGPLRIIRIDLPPIRARLPPDPGHIECAFAIVAMAPQPDVTTLQSSVRFTT
jgi:hypothetical protein